MDLLFPKGKQWHSPSPNKVLHLSSFPYLVLFLFFCIDDLGLKISHFGPNGPQKVPLRTRAHVIFHLWPKGMGSFHLEFTRVKKCEQILESMPIPWVKITLYCVASSFPPRSRTPTQALNPRFNAWFLADSAKYMDILNWEEELDGEAMLGPYEVWKSIEFMLGVIWYFYTLTLSSLPHGPQKLLSPQGYLLLLPLIIKTSYLPLNQREPCIFPVCLKEAYIFILGEGGHTLPDITGWVWDILLNKWVPDFPSIPR